MSYYKLLDIFNFRRYRSESRGSSVGMAMGDRKIGVRFPDGARDASVLRSVQTDSGAHPVSYPVGVGGCIPDGTATEA
jgi:hypothetical protein